MPWVWLAVSLLLCAGAPASAQLSPYDQDRRKFGEQSLEQYDRLEGLDRRRGGGGRAAHCGAPLDKAASVR